MHFLNQIVTSYGKGASMPETCSHIPPPRPSAEVRDGAITQKRAGVDLGVRAGCEKIDTRVMTDPMCPVTDFLASSFHILHTFDLFTVWAFLTSPGVPKGPPCLFYALLARRPSRGWIPFGSPMFFFDGPSSSLSTRTSGNKKQ